MLLCGSIYTGGCNQREEETGCCGVSEEEERRRRQNQENIRVLANNIRDVREGR